VTLSLSRDGAERFPWALSESELSDVEALVCPIPPDRAGIRLHGNPDLASWLKWPGPMAKIAAVSLGESCRPVRALLFNKTADMNWSLGWHQDRTILVKRRMTAPGFGPWTMKDGLLHVAPPFEVLAGMTTLRLHFDPVAATNAPLLIAPGSHKLGRIRNDDIPNAIEGCGVVRCLADAGDIWVYATPILHASERAEIPACRRVLQVDFAAAPLPGGIEWLGL